MLVTHLLVFTQTDISRFTVDSRRAKCEERNCSQGGASSRRRFPPFMLDMQLLSFVSAHYCKCIFKARQLEAKPQLWCDKFIFTKMCSPMLCCCCCSPALLTQAERFVNIKEHQLFHILTDNGGNKFNGS